jgi:hypothetical protein
MSSVSVFWRAVFQLSSAGWTTVKAAKSLTPRLGVLAKRLAGKAAASWPACRKRVAKHAGLQEAPRSCCVGMPYSFTLAESDNCCISIANVSAITFVTVDFCRQLAAPKAAADGQHGVPAAGCSAAPEAAGTSHRIH